MKRYLYLLRHAKSSWNYPELDDFERPLNKRGRHDVPVMAGVIRKTGAIPDEILASPATRAAMTARIVAEILRIDDQHLQFNYSVYEASPSGLLQTVRETDNRVHRLMLVGHNPGLTTFANFLTGHHLENIPTAGLCGIELLVGKWNELGEHCGKFLFLKTPKSN